jgi:putative hydrolase of the HAD superfamily
MPIRAVVFDVGNVILEIDLDNRLRAMGFTQPWSAVESWSVHHDLETGKIAPEEFFRRMKEHFSLAATESELQEHWNLIPGRVIAGMDELLAELKERVQVAALTNTNPPHLRLFRQMEEFRHLHRIFASHEMGFRKPDRQIYETLIRELDVAPEEILFFDDLEKNIAAATKAGIQARLCYRSAETARACLQEWNVISKKPQS